MASPFPFTSGQVLTAAQLNSIGEATAFTPSWTNLTPGNATEAWYYVQVQDFVFVTGRTIFGSTTAVTGTISFGFPVATARIDENPTGLIQLFDSSPTTRILGGGRPTGTALQIFAFGVSGSNVIEGAVNATSPFTWASGDQIRGSFAYQLS